MRICAFVVGIGFMLTTAAGFAQTAVTTSGGTTNTVPVYTGSVSIGNSPITVSGSNIGVNGNVQINSLGGGTNNGIYAGNGDGASSSTVDLAIESWWGLGFKTTCCSNSGITWNYPIVFDTRAGSIYAEGNVGIGTVSPAYMLDVAGGNARIYGVGYSKAGNYAGLYLGDGDAGVAAAWGSGLRFDVYNPSGGGTLGSNSMDAMSIQQQTGNVGIGTTSPAYTLDVNGAVHTSSGITYPDGTVQTTAFNPTLCGGDYAESVDVSGDRTRYEPGDVLVIDSSSPGKFLKSAEPYATSVTGIYSTKPGTVGRRQTTLKSPDEVPMAMIGIVPTKVSAENGAIQPGDLLVTSSRLGYAMKGTDRSRMLGAVIGKALGNLDSGTGVIEVVVMLQ